MCCSGALYWSGGTGSPGYIYTLGRVSGVLKKFSLAGNTLTLAGVAANAGNFSTYGGALLSLTAYCAQHIKVPDRTQLRHRLALEGCMSYRTMDRCWQLASPPRLNYNWRVHAG